MLPKAILFDLDDTIVSYNEAGKRAWVECCNAFVNRVDTSFDVVALLESIEKAKRWYWGDLERHRIGRLDLNKARREVVKIALTELKFFDESIANELADHFSGLQYELICLFPDSIETLEKLKKAGTRMALITNGASESQRGKINRFCLSGFFEFCLVEGEIGYGKPDVRVFETALQMLELSADEVWMVGDNLVWDIEAPQKLGIYSIWNDYGKVGLPENSMVIPDRIIHSISELLL